jgi:hypothetical protein
VSMRSPTGEEARLLAEALELDMHDAGVCLACLWFVGAAVHGGDEADIRRTTSQFSRWLWEEGLALPLRRALERERVRGSAVAERAIADVDRRGGRSIVVKAVVRHLAEDMAREWRLPKRAQVIELRR